MEKTTFHIITIFPEFFDSPLRAGLMGKAIKKGMINFEFIDLKKFESVLDDRPYGGGQGMVLKIEPIVSAIRNIKPRGEKIIKILTSPSGNLLTQERVEHLSEYTDIVIICGRYEGVDARVSYYIDDEISIGDYIIHSGETSALVLIEAISRLKEGFKSKTCTEELSLNLLGFPQYTRPREFEGHKVPEELLSGNHKEIRNFRIRKSVEKTMTRRPDLIEKILKNLETTEYKDILNKAKDKNDIKEILENYFENLKIDPDPFI